MSKRFSSLALPAVLLFTSVLVAQSPSLSIEVNNPTAKVSPTLYGLMTEEINFSYDGGLYAELVRDRAIPAGPPAPLSCILGTGGAFRTLLSRRRQTAPH